MKNQPKALLLGTCLTVSGMLFSPESVTAQVVTLSDGGSTAAVNLSSSAGMYDWEVGTDNQMQNELNQQWFWYSISGSTNVYSLNQLGTAVINNQTGNFLDAEYGNSQLSIDVQYSLTGGGVNSGSADITESVTVYNNSNTPFNINLFEYSNFNLLLNSANTLEILGGPGAYTEAYQYSGSTALAEGIISPDANFAEAGSAAATLSAVEAGTLNGNLNASGDVAWAFEWSSSVTNGTPFYVVKDKELQVSTVPEPSNMAFAALIGVGLGAVGLSRRRQSA